MENNVEGVFQAGVLVSDVDECLRLFRDALGMKVAFEARNSINTSKGLTGVDRQVMHVLMLRGDDGVDLEIHQYVDPPAKPRPPMNHSDIGSMHFMLRVKDMDDAVKKVTELGYELMTPVVESQRIKGFKYTYFRGPDGMMVELHQGVVRMPGKEDK